MLGKKRQRGASAAAGDNEHVDKRGRTMATSSSDSDAKMSSNGASGAASGAAQGDESKVSEAPDHSSPWSNVGVRPHANNLEVGIIGNCTFGFLIDRYAKVVWGCLPRFDSEPMFSFLLTGGDAEFGFFDVQMERFSHSYQKYVTNTAIMETVLYDKDGGAVKVTDFAPRFKMFDRSFHPAQMVRILEPVAGRPMIRVRVRPAMNQGSEPCKSERGSNHIRYSNDDMTVRLTTDVPVSFIADEIPFVLQKEQTLIFGPNESMTRSPNDVAHEFLTKTTRYWRDFARMLNIPFQWQEAVIRSAISLKLCAYEESGAILAAMTTSIPEAANSGRCWDYRFCWLRDSFHTVRTLNRLGATGTMEDYLRFLTNVIAQSEHSETKDLQPLYGLLMQTKCPESVTTLKGYRGMGPVRIGNEAYVQLQNDNYGSVILAVAQMFFDQRISSPGTRELFEQLEHLGEKAIEAHDVPDAGLWELRTSKQVHTFSSLMCWAGCDRLAKIAEKLELAERETYWRAAADKIKAYIIKNGWDAERKTFVATLTGGGKDLDASTLLMAELGFIAPTDERFVGTVDAIGRTLKRGKFLFRYANKDDFGYPETAFNICTFWYIDALALIGRKKEALEMFETMLAHRNHMGILSEDIDPKTGELWGNIVQTYSMCGLINSAMRLSDSWFDHGL